MDAAAHLLHDSRMESANAFEAARLTVRLPSIVANYKSFRRVAGPAAVGAVVKADAYGLGALRVAPALAQSGCDSFFVARLEEGIALRAVLPDARIFVFDGAHDGAIPALIAHRLTPCLNSLQQIAGWSARAIESHTALDAVVHVDTGMRRLGLAPDELATLAGEARARLKGLNLVMVMSHLACADETGDTMNTAQLSRFRQALAMLPQAPASLAASHGTFLSPDYHFDLVRPGVALYGANPQPGGPNLMQTAAVLSGKVLQLRRIDSGDTVGYGATFRATRPSMLATIALGYADGVPRALSNKGFGAIARLRAPIAGRVSMDTIILDVSGLTTPPRVGDDVEILGDTVTLTEVATAAGTNEYEILTRLALRVPRHYESQQ
jgi:alanine racemase